MTPTSANCAAKKKIKCGRSGTKPLHTLALGARQVLMNQEPNPTKHSPTEKLCRPRCKLLHRPLGAAAPHGRLHHWRRKAHLITPPCAFADYVINPSMMILFSALIANTSSAQTLALSLTEQVVPFAKGVDRKCAAADISPPTHLLNASRAAIGSAAPIASKPTDNMKCAPGAARTVDVSRQDLLTTQHKTKRYHGDGPNSDTADTLLSTVDHQGQLRDLTQMVVGTHPITGSSPFRMPSGFGA